MGYLVTTREYGIECPEGTCETFEEAQRSAIGCCKRIGKGCAPEGIAYRADDKRRTEIQTDTNGDRYYEIGAGFNASVRIYP